MRSRDIYEMFCKYFNCFKVSVEDFIKIILYFSSGKCMNLLKFILFIYSYHHALNIKFESPPLICVKLFRIIKNLIRLGILNIEGDRLCLSQSCVGDVYRTINEISRCDFVIIGSLCMKPRDLYFELSSKVSYFEKCDVHLLLVRSFEDFLVRDVNSLDILDIVKLILRQLC